jgi:putative membrane protein
MKGLLAAVSVSALLAAAPAWAQNTAAENRTLSQQDKTFVEQAGAGNLAEAELGQLAEQRAERPAVKEFGRWMYTDHGLTATKWLEAILRDEHETFHPTLTSEQTQLKQRLEGLRGSEFDRQYVEHMVQDHEKTIPIFEKEAKDGHNPWLKAYAEDLTPVLQQHLAEAKELAGTGGVAEREGPAGTTERTGTSAPQR